MRDTTGFREPQANDSAGIAQCLAHLRPLKPALIVLEATVGWQGPLVAVLAVAKLPVAVVNPRQIRDFAKATGQLAKTDALDAGVIAHFAEAVHSTPRPLPDEMTQQLDALLQRRRQLLERLLTSRPPQRRSSSGVCSGGTCSST